MTGSTEKDKRDRGKRYLLILSCSKRKKDVETARAIDLYDGPFYRTLRKHRPPNLDTLIISAKHGLIRADDVISPYDQRMTGDRAKELSKTVNSEIKRMIRSDSYEGIMVNLGAMYMAVLNDMEDELDQPNVTYAHGMIGERNKQLKEWLTDILAE